MLPDGLDLLGKKGSRLVTLEVSEKRSAVCEGSGAGSKSGGTLWDQWMDARTIKYPPVMEKPCKASREICQ